MTLKYPERNTTQLRKRCNGLCATIFELLVVRDIEKKEKFNTRLHL